MNAVKENNTLITGLLFIEPEAQTLFDRYNLVDEPLNRLSPERLRPSIDSLDRINEMLFLK